MKPLISYYGGKQRIASKITPYIEAIPHTVYNTPFAGGLGVFYARTIPLVSNGDHYRENINDLSGDLINLYRVAREQPDEFYRWISLTPFSQAEHKHAISILKTDTASPLQRAWAYYVNIQQSFANKLNAGWGVSIFNENTASTWENKVARIPECLERLKAVHISQEDALRCIERWDSPQTLHYLDPPYPGTEQGHYSGYSLDDWQALCDLLDNIQGSYVLSNYHQDVQPKSAQQVISISAICSSSGSGKTGKNRDKARAATASELGDRKRTEYLWICDRSHAARKDLVNVLDRQKRRQTTIFDVLGA